MQVTVISDGVNDGLGPLQDALNSGAERVILVGRHRVSDVPIMRTSGQHLVAEGLATIEPDTSEYNGLAIVHGAIGCRVSGVGFVGRATSEAASRHTGILVNSNASGTDPYGSTTADDGGHRVDRCRFTGATASMGWNSAIHSNMCNDVTAEKNVVDSIFGTSSGYGYGIVMSGDRLKVLRNKVAAIANQGRHAIYLTYCSDFSIGHNLTEGFQSSAIALNTGVTAGNKSGRIYRNTIKTPALGANVTFAGIEATYQAPASSGGADLDISRNIIIGSASGGMIVSGYSAPQLVGNILRGFSSGIASAHGIKIISCPDADVFGNSVFSDINDETLVLVEVIASDRAFVHHNRLRSKTGTNRAAVRLNATPPVSAGCQTLDNMISGEFLFKVENGAQGGSLCRNGAPSYKLDAQTGADVAIDVTNGEQYVSVSPGCTSLIQLIPQYYGQEVTLRFAGNTQVKLNNFYLNGGGVFNATANDCLTLVCGQGGSSPLWWEVSRSVN